MIARMGEVALRMIDDGETVMLMTGPVCRQIATRIEDRSNLTVLTNSLSIGERISRQPMNKGVLIGGDIDLQEQAVYGPLALDNVQRFFVNQLFIEVDGITEHLEMTVSSAAKADLIRKVMQSASRTIAICLPDHFGTRAFARLGMLSEVDAIVTDPSADDAYKTRVFGSGTPVFTSVVSLEDGA